MPRYVLTREPEERGRGPILHQSEKPAMWRQDDEIIESIDGPALTAPKKLIATAKAPRPVPKVLPNLKPKRWAELVGTPKQIAWASAIRKEYADDNPKSEMLFTCRDARWWIENRDSLE